MTQSSESCYRNVESESIHIRHTHMHAHTHHPHTHTHVHNHTPPLYIPTYTYIHTRTPHDTHIHTCKHVLRKHTPIQMFKEYQRQLILKRQMTCSVTGIQNFALGLVSSGLETISLIYLGTACPADIGTFLKSTVSVNCDLKSLYFKTHYNQVPDLTIILMPFLLILSFVLFLNLFLSIDFSSGCGSWAIFSASWNAW